MELDERTAATPIGQVLERSTMMQSPSGTDSNGYILPSEPKALKAWEVEAQKRQEAQKIRQRNSVWKAFVEARGARYAEAKLENYDAKTPKQQAAKAAVADYAKSIAANLKAAKNVLFIGPAGTGKDHLLTPLCRAAIGDFRTLIWTTGTNLWLTFRDAIGEKTNRRAVRFIDDYDGFDDDLGGTEIQIISKLATVDVLCISDPLPPGSGLTDYQVGNLLQIIDKRYSHLLPTWMTINVANRAEAEQRMGGPTVDRLCHDALTIICDWPSYRQRKQEAA